MDDSLYLQAAFNRNSRDSSRQTDVQRIYGGRVGLRDRPIFNQFLLDRQKIEQEELRKELARQAKIDAEVHIKASELAHKKRLDEMENEKRLLVKMLHQQQKSSCVAAAPAAPTIVVTTAPTLQVVEQEPASMPVSVAPKIIETPAFAKGPEDDTLICVVCMDQRRTMMCNPCGHFALCATCGSNIVKCPMQMGTIVEMKKIFLV